MSLFFSKEPLQLSPDYITGSAGPITTTMRERYDGLEEEFLAGVSTRQQTTLLKILQKVYHNLSSANTQSLGLIHLLTHIVRLLSRHFDRELKQLGFTRSQWLVLDAIYPQQGISQIQLAQALHMQKAPLGVLVDELERGNWVERRADPDDRRVRQLYLTPHCSRQWQTLKDSYEAMHRKCLHGIPDKQRQQLRQSLQAIRDNLKAIAQQAKYPLRNDP